MLTPKPESTTLGKKKFYLFCTVLLCLLLLFVVYEIAETAYINYALSHGIGLKTMYTFEVLWILAAIGVGIGGTYLGKYWRRIVYIEKRHWKNYFRK